MPDPTRTLPPEPSLEQQKKLAKELLHAFRARDAGAHTRMRRQLPDKQRITLADAQFVLAREYGFKSWAELKTHLEAARGAITDVVRDAFTRAVESRNATELRGLLTREPAARTLINEPLFSFDTSALLHVAGDDSTLPLVEVLLEFGADPNRRSDWWAGAFHVLHSASGTTADRLIAAGAVLDACAAARLDRVDVLRRLLDDDPARVHERGGDGQTPLHFARSRDAVDLLLQRGADPDARDVDHRSTPAQWMLTERRGAGRYDLARYLVERGATADIFLAAALGLTKQLRVMLADDPTLLQLRTGQGAYGEQPPSSFHIYTWTIGQNKSPLQVATQFEQHEAVELMRAYAGPKERFLHACMEARADAARVLLHEQPALLAELTADDMRALPDAAWSANAAAVELMLELGFDPAAIGGIGGTVLHCAAWQGSVLCAEVALRYPQVRALIEMRDPTHGGTPLSWCWHGALNCGNPEADHAGVARLLIRAGAQPPGNWEEMPEQLRTALQALFSEE